jgi:hypothetical protein
MVPFDILKGLVGGSRGRASFRGQCSCAAPGRRLRLWTSRRPGNVQQSDKEGPGFFPSPTTVTWDRLGLRKNASSMGEGGPGRVFQRQRERGGLKKRQLLGENCSFLKSLEGF